jgi:hypothetical protein
MRMPELKQSNPMRRASFSALALAAYVGVNDTRGLISLKLKRAAGLDVPFRRALPATAPASSSAKERLAELSYVESGTVLAFRARLGISDGRYRPN